MKTPIVYIYTATRIKLNPPRLGITSALLIVHSVYFYTRTRCLDTQWKNEESCASANKRCKLK